jgi:lipopolysaccharide export system permease protein
MKTLDRYIIRQFLFNVVALLVILFCFVVTIDIALNIDRFLRAADQISRAGGQPVEGLGRVAFACLLALDWWWPRLLMLFNFLLGTVMVGAMGFTFSQMARHRELVAVLAGGLSLHRVGRPIMLSALGLTGLAILNQELVLPPIAPLLTRDHNAVGRHELGVSSLPLTPDAHNRLFAARQFDADAEILEGLYILERDEPGTAIRVITSARAHWDGGAWILEEPRVEARRAGAPTDVGPIQTDLDPTTLKMRRSAVLSQNLGTAKLTQLLRRPGLLDQRSRDQIERIRLGRFATMAANLLTLVIAMPFFLTRVPGNQLLRSLACAPIAIVALVGGVLGAAAAVPGLPAWLSTAIPVLILAPVAIAMISVVKT